MTTALVVLSPTPLAPPVVVKPHEQLMTEMMVPNTQLLIMLTMMSQLSIARDALSKMTLALTPYTASARNTLAAMPIVKQRRLRTGAAIMLANTRGVIR